MKNTVLFLLVLIVGFILLGWYGSTQMEEEVDITTEDQARELAENWIRENSPTYTFDGSDLTFIEGSQVGDNRFELIFDFESSQAGYGDRSGEMLAQVITPHTIVVAVDDGRVVEAVTDDVFSELEGDMLSEEDQLISVNVYFLEVVDGSEELVAVERSVDANNPERGALESLLDGLTETDSDDYFTSINEGVEILSFDIEDKMAFVDFNSRLDEGVAGSATVMAIYDQIEQTLLQFESIDEVVISVEGESEEILQP